MKKLSIVFIIGSLIAIGLLWYGFNIDIPQSTQTNKPPECSNIPKSDIESERSLGLIISDRRLLSILLAEEKNYSPPGGHMVRNENPKDTLRRELVEELNLNISTENLMSYKTTCIQQNDLTLRTHYYFVDVEEQSIDVTPVSGLLKWVDYSFVQDSKADQELKQALYFLKQDNLVD